MSQVNVSAFAHIRKEGDFLDFLKFETEEKILQLDGQLKNAASAAGTARSEFTDFLRQRIGQIGRALALSA
jgi:hypothetical protein